MGTHNVSFTILRPMTETPVSFVEFEIPAEHITTTNPTVNRLIIDMKTPSFMVILIRTTLVYDNGLCQKCQFHVDDELWNQQWYLNASMNNMYDLNVLPAWRSCANGTGVNVAVIDLGIQDHVDLKIGRKGKGALYVFATGNFGSEDSSAPDSCAYDGRISNIYVITVAGIQHNLKKVPSGEGCSNMMVSAFTTKYGESDLNLVTLDVGNTSTVNFGRNSAAVPMVSGAVALALSANPSLTYRDVMHLLARTSRNQMPELKNGEYPFIRNAANFSVSSYFGFGLLDIGELVIQSISWNNVPAKKTCSATSSGLKRVTDLPQFIKLQLCDVDYIEHVEVTLIVENEYAGKLQWDLISPSGTLSTLLPGRRYDIRSTMNITVVTVQMWGESPKGNWMLKPIAAYSPNLGNGSLNYAKITVHGFTCRFGVDCGPSKTHNETDSNTTQNWFTKPDPNTKTDVPINAKSDSYATTDSPIKAKTNPNANRDAPINATTDPNTTADAPINAKSDSYATTYAPLKDDSTSESVFLRENTSSKWNNKSNSDLTATFNEGWASNDGLIYIFIGIPIMALSIGVTYCAVAFANRSRRKKNRKPDPELKLVNVISL